MQKNPLAWLAAVTLTVSLASIGVQFAGLITQTRDTIGPALATLRFLSYFTILSNLLVCAVLAMALRTRSDASAGWWQGAAVRGAAALYIGTTGLVFATVLSALVDFSGWQWWANAGLHYAVPVLYLCWWLLMPIHGALRWSVVLRWLLFPAAYLAWTLLRGRLLGEYPYPFVDLAALGLATTLRNCVGVLLVLVVLGLVLVAVDRSRGRGTSGEE